MPSPIIRRCIDAFLSRHPKFGCTIDNQRGRDVHVVISNHFTPSMDGYQLAKAIEGSLTYIPATLETAKWLDHVGQYYECLDSARQLEKGYHSE